MRTGGLVSVEDASCNKLTELMLNIEEVRSRHGACRQLTHHQIRLAMYCPFKPTLSFPSLGARLAMC